MIPQRYWILPLLFLLVRSAHGDETSIPTQDFGIAASPTRVWIFQQRLEGQPPRRRLRFAYLDPNVELPKFTRPQPVNSVAGEIGVAAALGQRLHIIFSDGTHRSYDENGLYIEHNLPGGIVPLLWASDYSTNSIYALVPSEAAQELPSLDAGSPPPEGSPADLTDPDLSKEQAPEDVERPSIATPNALVQFAQGRWHLVSEGPQAAANRLLDIFVANENQCHFFFSKSISDPTTWHSSVVDSGWTEPTPIEQFTSIDVLAGNFHEGQLQLLTQEKLWQSQTGQWKAINLPTPIPDHPQVAWTGSRLMVAQLGTNQEVSYGFWPIKDQPNQDPSSTLQPIEALQPLQLTWMATNMAWLAYASMGVVLIVVFTRRRASLITPAQLQPGQILAPFSRRLLGFLLDILLFLPMGGYVLWPALSAYIQLYDQYPSMDRVHLYSQLPGDYFLRWLIAIAGFATYVCIFEAVSGASPGKRLVQCKVVTESGERPRFWAIFARNLIRLIEMFPPFELMPAAVLVLLTRNRQRLGDLVARTVVVETVTLPPDKPESPDLETHA